MAEIEFLEAFLAYTLDNQDMPTQALTDCFLSSRQGDETNNINREK